MKTPAQIKKEMGERLKQARKSAGYTSAEDFCEKHNISLEAYLQHENGQKGIKASNAQQYCKLLHIKMGWLIIGEK